MSPLGKWRERIRHTPRISPGGFVLYAAALAVLYAVLHLLGLRECASVVSGTPPTVFGSEDIGVALGVAYILFHFATVVLAPALLIAAATWPAGARLLRRRGEPQGPELA